MNKYEVMLIVKADLSEDDKKALFSQISEVIVKHGGKVLEAAVWSERRKLTFKIKKSVEGIYYVVVFNVPAEGLTKIRYAYRLNESILRILITKL